MPFPRTPPAAKSHLGLAWHGVRRGRAGGCAEQDGYCSAQVKMATALHKSKWLLLRRSQNGYELAVELSEPLVLFLQSLSTPPAFGYSRCSIA